MLGTFVLSAGYYDAYFGKAQAVRRMVKEWTDKTLSEYDVLLCPTTPSTAFELGREVSDPTLNYLEDIFTVQANIAGTPAVSIPIGVDPNGLPIGLQVMGANGSDMDTLAIAAWIQSNKNAHILPSLCQLTGLLCLWTRICSRFFYSVADSDSSSCHRFRFGGLVHSTSD